MLLKANKYRKDKKADCRQNELGSRIFVGRVFVDYSEGLRCGHSLMETWHQEKTPAAHKMSYAIMFYRLG